jgi:hypothetical protein
MESRCRKLAESESVSGLERYFGAHGPERVEPFAEHWDCISSRILHYDDRNHDGDDHCVRSRQEARSQAKKSIDRPVFDRTGLSRSVSAVAGNCFGTEPSQWLFCLKSRCRADPIERQSRKSAGGTPALPAKT